MNRITRCDDKENYNITVPWLIQFAQSLEKGAHGIDYLQQLFQTNEKFNTIEEKMADIKERIGFDLLNKVSEELENSDKTITASEECSCEKECSCKVTTATFEHSEEDISIMESILGYIGDMTKSEPHLDVATVVSRCREEDGLKFEDIRINLDKLKEHIGQQLESHKDMCGEEVIYVQPTAIADGEADDDIADYHRRTESL